VNLFIQASAEEDILRQVAWYADQGLPHIARRFHTAVLGSIDAALAMPEAGPPRPSGNPRLAGLRAWPVKGFGEFWIYYLVRPERITVVRVLHSKRDIGAVLEGQDVADQ
jgi:plasmid stabilization system protein ParE